MERENMLVPQKSTIPSKDDLFWPPYMIDTLENSAPRPDGSDIIYPEEALNKTKFSQMRNEEIWELIKAWKFIEDRSDFRMPTAYKTGGNLAENDKLIGKMRNIAKEVIKNVGKKILTGNFNLTTISFPIKAMVPKSQLENLALATVYFPLYMNLAAQSTDPLQRFKYNLVANIAYFHLINCFAKPLNPIIGETLQAHYNDGSKIYLEQTSHHPPVSYILMYGPNGSYKHYGPSQFSASLGLNSLSLVIKGWRKCEFKNPTQTIHNTLSSDKYDGTFFGQCVHEVIGNIEFLDRENQIYCDLKLGKVKKMPSDYLEGEIKVKGVVVSKITGTYLGWLQIDGNRYFDIRYITPFKFNIERSRLGSDFSYRSDLLYLSKWNFDRAQKEKEKLEHVQRTDAKLRKTWAAEQEKAKKK